MGFFDNLFGSAGADTARNAAQQQYTGEQGAIGNLTNAGSTYASGMAGLSNKFDPYVQGGGQAQNQLYALMGLQGQDPQNAAFNQFRSDPGYQFQMQQGQQALDRSAAARGGSSLQSGRTIKDTLGFSQGLADQSYGGYLQRLMALGQQGQQATGQQVQTAGQGLTGQLQTGLTGAPLAFKSASTIPMGDIAAQNADNAASQNLLNLGMKVGGMALGGLTGGSSFGLGGLGSLMGGPTTTYGAAGNYGVPTFGR